MMLGPVTVRALLGGEQLSSGEGSTDWGMAAQSEVGSTVERG